MLRCDFATAISLCWNKPFLSLFGHTNFVYGSSHCFNDTFGAVSMAFGQYIEQFKIFKYLICWGGFMLLFPCDYRYQFWLIVRLCFYGEALQNGLW